MQNNILTTRITALKVADEALVKERTENYDSIKKQARLHEKVEEILKRYTVDFEEAPKPFELSCGDAYFFKRYSISLPVEKTWSFFTLFGKEVPTIFLSDIITNMEIEFANDKSIRCYAPSEIIGYIERDNKSDSWEKIELLQDKFLEKLTKMMRVDSDSFHRTLYCKGYGPYLGLRDSPGDKLGKKISEKLRKLKEKVRSK